MAKVKIVFKGGVVCNLKVNEMSSWLAYDIQNKMETQYAFCIESETGNIIINPENVMCITVMEVKE